MRKIMLKKTSAALLIAALLCVMLCSCIGRQRVALVISGAEIKEEVFTCFLDKVVAGPAEYGLTRESPTDDFAKSAQELCMRYVAANTRFEKSGLYLTAAEKTAISQSVNNLWIRYENHYNKIGVSRQTLNKIETAKAYEEKLFSHSYDKEVGSAAAESEITSYYYQNYIVFRAVCVYYTAHDGVTPMTGLQKTELTENLNRLVNQYNAKKDFDEAATEFGYTASASSLLKRGSSGYPEGFFDEVAAIEDGAAAVLIYNDCAFVVLRESLKEKGEEYYSIYRGDCLKELYAPIAEQDIAAEIGGYTIERKDYVISSVLRNIDKLG